MNEIVRRAVELLRSGDIVAGPTETVYGLFADACRDDAVRKVFQAKGRDSSTPLVVLVGSVEMAKEVCSFDEEALELVKHFWIDRGLSLSVVLPKKSDSKISELVTAGRDTVAVRVQRDGIALLLINSFGGPLVAPSANRSSRISPISYGMVMCDLGNDVPFVIDGGACNICIESTILDISKKPYEILRLGCVPQEEIEEFVGKDVVCRIHHDPKIAKKQYSPSIKVRINADVPSEGEAFIAFGETTIPFDENLSESGDLVEASRNLFYMIGRLDNPEKYTGIAIMPIPDHGIGKTINDRLFFSSL